MDKKTIIDYIADDVEYYGFYFENCNSIINPPEGAYRVALFIYPGYDFHWYRQNPDGTWSHKLGSEPVTNCDFSGNIIYDPEESNRYNVKTCANYDTLIGYFYVTPLNRIYGQ